MIHFEIFSYNFIKTSFKIKLIHMFFIFFIIEKEKRRKWLVEFINCIVSIYT